MRNNSLYVLGGATSSLPDVNDEAFCIFEKINDRREFMNEVVFMEIG